MQTTSPLSYEFHALTDTGRVRSNNEDAVAVNEAARLAILADGMGGYNAGEVASNMATQYINSEMARWLREQGPGADAAGARQALEDCVANANHAILGASLANPQYAGMGTTIVVALFLGRRLVLGHVGDSRCYRLRAGQLGQLTRDHSWLQEQIDAGLLTPEEAAQSPQRNLVTRALGVEGDVFVEINEFPVEPQDLYILCSDGLHDMVDDGDLAAIARQTVSLQDKAQRMLDLANGLGGRDNISVLLVQASAGPAA
jgi:protein phosphatase